jgi:transcriptional regulator
MSMNPIGNDTATLRPIERRVVHLADRGVDQVEIARRFQRSPEFIGRVIEMAAIPGREAHPSETAPELRPVERCILGWRERGADAEDIALRLHRSADSVARIEDLARYKLAAR